MFGFGKLFAALARLFTSKNERAAVAIADAANREFSGSIEGIHAGIELDKAEGIAAYNTLIKAAGSLKTQVNTAQKAYTDAQDKKAMLDRALNGVLSDIEALQGASSTEDKEKLAELMQDAEEIDQNLQETIAQVASAKISLTTLEAGRKEVMAKIKMFSAKLAELDSKKAKLTAKFISAQALAAAYDELAGIRGTTFTMSRTQAIEQGVEQMWSETETRREIANADFSSRVEKYAAKGASVDSGGRVQQMLAARRAARDASTGGTAVPAAKATVTEGASASNADSADERPKTGL